MSDVVGSFEGSGGITVAIRSLAGGYAIEMSMPDRSTPVRTRMLSAVDLNQLEALIALAKTHATGGE